MGFPGGSAGKDCLRCLPIVQETRVGALALENPLERDMAVHSNILI